MEKVSIFLLVSRSEYMITPMTSVAMLTSSVQTQRNLDEILLLSKIQNFCSLFTIDRKQRKRGSCKKGRGGEKLVFPTEPR